ncbi:MAG TPA: hypothetical protein VH008_32895 [Pseudonocardia sp.]|nr:hypothetical protein [Pseudonocardia sp.]
MRFSRRIAVIAVSAVLLVVGVVLGFIPVKATMTEIEPELRLLTVSCGNGFLQASPPLQAGDLVALPQNPVVYLPRADYATHCAEAAGWKRYAAWGLTAVGALGLAITFSAARTPSAPGLPRRSRGASAPARRSRRRGEGGAPGDDAPGEGSPAEDATTGAESADEGQHSRRNEPAS